MNELFIGYKVLIYNELKKELYSPYLGYSWHPGANIYQRRREALPDKDNVYGFWAFGHISQAVKELIAEDGRGPVWIPVIVQVALWGRVVVHSRGYRSQYARIDGVTGGSKAKPYIEELCVEYSAQPFLSQLPDIMSDLLSHYQDVKRRYDQKVRRHIVEHSLTEKHGSELTSVLEPLLRDFDIEWELIFRKVLRKHSSG